MIVSTIMNRPIPVNEDERLRVLDELKILDTDRDWKLDSILALAAHICDAPMAAISLVDRDRQWFKSRLGVSCSETPREESFCQYTIVELNGLTVHDATKDPRFASLDMVTGSACVRFYVGLPLEVQGVNIGAICLMDTRPRSLTQNQYSALSILAGLAAHVIRAEACEAQLSERYLSMLAQLERPNVA